MKDARGTIAQTVASTRAVDYDTVLPCDYDTADAILAAMPEIVGAMVKPLEWECMGCICDKYEAGDYKIVDFTYYDGGFSLFLHGNGQFPEFDTLDEAKQAANDHNRAQVLGALGLA